MTIATGIIRFCTVFAYLETMARPRKDTIDTHRLILKLAETGMTNAAIAEAAGLSVRTVCNYLSGTELGDAVRQSRQAALELDEDKKAAMNKAAIAAAKRLLRKRKTKEVEKRIDADGNVYMTIEKEKEIEPHAGIVQLVLKSTDPKTWREQQAADNTDAPEDTELKVIIDDN